MRKEENFKGKSIVRWAPAAMFMAQTWHQSHDDD